MPRKLTCEGCKKRDKCTELCESIEKIASQDHVPQDGNIIYAHQLSESKRSDLDDVLYGSRYILPKNNKNFFMK